MDRLGENEENLREACYLEDFEKVKELIEAGADVNSRNKVNKWTALHWAVSRNNATIVNYLLSRGADEYIENDKGQKPFQLSSSPEVDKCFSLSVPNLKDGKRSNEFNLGIIENRYGFVPNFIKHRQFSHSVRDRQTNHQLETDFVRSRDICIKARVADGEETDFIELEIDLELCSFAEFKSLLCRELLVDCELQTVKKIRKLPNVIVRNDRDIKRLKEGTEIELIIALN